MLQEELTSDLRHLAAELDELGENESSPAPSFPSIPDFEPVSLLGSGGMGAVYVARQVSLGRDVAVKVVPSHGALPEEARTVAQLHHPNIVQVFSAGGDSESAWFAMELVKGESAGAHTFASAEDVVRLGIAVAEALAYAHRCGILHRDVKPSNIFVGDNGMAKLGDFGLACLASDSVKDKSGTKRYMAPEVLDGGEVSAASDQYSLGVTLRELMARITPGAPPTPDLAAILSRATAHDPSGRYESVEAMIDDLRRFLAHKPVAANPPSLSRRFRLFARRNPLAASGIVAASLLLAAFVAALAVGYIRTSRALAATEREAASAAQSLAMVVTTINVENQDKRDAEISRALAAAEQLAERFPDNAEISEAVAKLKHAREAHKRFKERRGGEMFPRRRSRPASRLAPRHEP